MRFFIGTDWTEILRERFILLLGLILLLSDNLNTENLEVLLKKMLTQN